MQISLHHRRALITGGSSGIGAAIATAFGEAGANVVISYLNHPEPAQAKVAELQALGCEALAEPVDIAQPDAVEALFHRIDQTWGGLDILVNCAGIDGPRAPAWESDLAAWRQVIEVNLLGAFACSRAALQRMIPRQSGTILNITSVHEVIAWSGYSAYTASKAGLAMLSRTLAQEAAPHGVRVLSLAPGAVRTPINREVWSHPAALRDLNRKIPLRRMGSPEEIARMATVLVSDTASYVTGGTVFVDGGMTDYADFAHGG